MAAPDLPARWALNVRPASFTLSRGPEVLSFDAEGRPLTWFRASTLHKRTLAGDWLARRRGPQGRERWTLGAEEGAALAHDLLAEVRAAHAELARAGATPAEPLSRALSWTPERHALNRARYHAAYRPVSILPPDQYHAVVVQATIGCSWNVCTFCTFYRDRPFTVRPLPEFRAHLQAVRALLGRGERLRRSLFLADGNALMLSGGKLLPLIAEARAAFPGRPVHGFLDVMTGQRRCVSGWAELARAGLRRVYLGLETGHDPLLAWLNKPGSADEAVGLIRDLKAAGLSVGPIFMTGVGGQAYARAHLDDTRRLLERLPLGRGDLVYFSPFVEHGPYLERARQAGVLPLSDSAVAAQEAALRAHLGRVHPEVRSARYDIREFVY